MKGLPTSFFCMLFLVVLPAQGAERMQPSAEAVEAFDRGDYAQALQLVQLQLRRCESLPPQAEECLDLFLRAAETAIGEVHPDFLREVVDFVIGHCNRYPRAYPLMPAVHEIVGGATVASQQSSD